MIEVDLLLPAPVVGPAAAAHAAGRAVLLFQDLGATAAGKPGFETSTRGAASVRTAAAETEAYRSDSVGLVTACLGELEIGPGDCQARHGHQLASPGLSSLLDLENPARETRTPCRAAGDS